jgi:hypothetical protein
MLEIPRFQEVHTIRFDFIRYIAAFYRQLMKI